MSKHTYRLDTKPVELETANEEQKGILQNAKKANGMIPNMYKNMVNLPALQNTYDFGYNQFRKESGFSPAEQEVVLLTISIDNSCGYCTAAHSYIAENVSKTPQDVIKAIRNGTRIEDERLKALHEFTKVMNETRGNPSPDQAQKFLDAGYSEKQILAIILAQAVKTISNYSNHVFHTEVDKAFADHKL
jgi:uncharacterized peroxidase-related enzyme